MQNNLSPIGKSIMNTITSSDFCDDGKNTAEVARKARTLLNLYELSLHSMSDSYHTTPRLLGIVHDLVNLCCKVRDLRSAHQHYFSIEEDHQLGQMIKSTNLQIAESASEMKEEMLRLESSVLPNV